MADLDGLLQMLDPKTLCRLDFVVDDAYKRFPLDNPVVEGSSQFQRLMGRYYRHLHRAVYCCPVAPDTEDSEALALGLVEHSFDGGRVEAFQMASRGCDGGLPAVLQKVAEAFKQQLFEAYFHEALRRSVALDSWQDRERLMRLYVEKYGHLLPSTARAVLPGILAANLENTIRAHVQTQLLLRRLPSHKQED